jgi:hypothetical protein
MKKLLLIAGVLAMFSQAIAQKNIVLRINHFLDTIPFAFNQKSVNNIGNEFNVTRMEYYLSKIIIKHDGGLTTNVNNIYALVNAGTNTDIELGSFNVNNIEGIQFSVGVDSPNNNADPSLWPATHPLSPKSPSMHWGWESGYRFAAMEGIAGIGMISTYEIHSLGNVNYFATSINKTATERNGKWIIAIDADYTEAIKDIDVTQNLVSHGETDEAKKLLINFRDLVFKPGTILTGINETKSTFDLGIKPNPSNGTFTLSLLKQASYNKIVVTDITGKVYFEEQFNATSTHNFNIKNKGIYFVQVYHNNAFIGAQKLVVQ